MNISESFVAWLREGIITYIYSGNFPIHELVLGGGSFKSITSQLHGIPGIVDISKDLDGNHGLGVLRHFIYSGQLANDVVPTHDQDVQRPGR